MQWIKTGFGHSCSMYEYILKRGNLKKLVKHGNLSSSHVCLLLGVLYIWVLKITAECKFCYQCLYGCARARERELRNWERKRLYRKTWAYTHTVKRGPWNWNDVCLFAEHASVFTLRKEVKEDRKKEACSVLSVNFLLILLQFCWLGCLVSSNAKLTSWRILAFCGLQLKGGSALGLHLFRKTEKNAKIFSRMRG